MKPLKKRFLAVSTVLALLLSLLAIQAQLAQAASTPISMIVTSVIHDSLVTVQFNNLPANTTYLVREGAAGTQAAGGSRIANFDTGSGGSKLVLFEVASSLYGAGTIDIGLDLGGTIVASTSFVNTSTTLPTVVSTPVPGTTATPAVTTTPTGGTVSGGTGGLSISVTGVEKDMRVTILASGLPANTTFTVLEGAAGTNGVGGYLMAHFDTLTGGIRSYTFEIATPLHGAATIDIRIFSDTMFAFTNFSNK